MSHFSSFNLPLATGGPESGRLLLWSAEEAMQSRTQIGVSACGATAVLNALAALGIPETQLPSAAEVNAAVGTHLRRPGGGLADYLLSRSCAGATPADLISGCHKLMGGNVAARFYPHTDIVAGGEKFLEWCHEAMSAGGVPILCMNLQLQGDRRAADWIPDAWHHQMSFGVDLGKRQLFLTNPLCSMTDIELERVLHSERELLVRAEDVVAQGRGQTAADISAALSLFSPRWKELQVFENAVRIIEGYQEESASQRDYLTIPAEYCTGATVLRLSTSLSNHMRKLRGKAKPTLHFTAHQNWAWVLEEVTSQGCWELDLKRVKHRGSRAMPSRVSVGGGRPQYALFRAELVAAGEIVQGAWATSQALEFLDPKDALYQNLCACGCPDVMPPTALLQWDISSADHIPAHLVPSTTKPYLLKAALGSGGYGLYFVTDPSDVVTIAKNHAAKALTVPDFVDKLRRDYGEVPCWSLQFMVPSMRVMDNRKCQFRSYILLSGSSLYIYQTVEARIVCWDSTMEAGELPEDEKVFCANTSAARPYNHGRMKVRTERIIVDEISELKAGEPALIDCTRKAFLALRPEIEKRMNKPDSKACPDNTFAVNGSMAVAGVDLLMDDQYNCYIVEINNNPAMPALEKNMSPRYKNHLIHLVSDILTVGLSGETEGALFTKIW